MAKKKKESGSTVLVEFRDIDNFDLIHKVGDDVSHFEKGRLDRLAAAGYVSGSSEAESDEGSDDSNGNNPE